MKKSYKKIIIICLIVCCIFFVCSTVYCASAKTPTLVNKLNSALKSIN